MIWPYLQLNPVSSCSRPPAPSRSMGPVDTPWNISQAFLSLHSNLHVEVTVALIPTTFHFQWIKVVSLSGSAQTYIFFLSYLGWCGSCYQQRSFAGFSRRDYYFSSFPCKCNFLYETVLALPSTCKLHSGSRPSVDIFQLNAACLASFIWQSQIKHVRLTKIYYYKLANYFMHFWWKMNVSYMLKWEVAGSPRN